MVRNGGYVATVSADMGMQKMHPRGDARRFYFVQHLLQILFAVRIELPVDLVIAYPVISPVAFKARVVEIHRPEPAHLGVLNMFIDRFRVYLRRPVIGSINQFAATTLYSSR